MIVAVKGIGGYHLMCDAGNAAAVARLRQRKQRPHKPLAVMFPQNAAILERHFELDPMHAALLGQPARAIVLVPKSQHNRLAPGIAPGLSHVGVMLPYSPRSEERRVGK